MKTIIKLIFISGLIFVCCISNSYAGRLLDLINLNYGLVNVRFDMRKLLQEKRFTDEEILEALTYHVSERQGPNVIFVICDWLKEQNKLDVINQSYGSLVPILLWYTSQGETLTVTRLIDEYDADPNVTRASDGMTPLAHAAMQNHHDICRALLERGAKKEMPIKGKKREDGKPQITFTATSLAKGKKHDELAEAIDKWSESTGFIMKTSEPKITVDEFEKSYRKGRVDLSSYLIGVELSLIEHGYPAVSDEQLATAKSLMIPFFRDSKYYFQYRKFLAKGFTMQEKQGLVENFNQHIQGEARFMIERLKKDHITLYTGDPLSSSRLKSVTLGNMVEKLKKQDQDDVRAAVGTLERRE